jgi:hypothetical protein
VRRSRAREEGGSTRRRSRRARRPGHRGGLIVKIQRPSGCALVPVVLAALVEDVIDPLVPGVRTQ